VLSTQVVLYVLFGGVGTLIVAYRRVHDRRCSVITCRSYGKPGDVMGCGVVVRFKRRFDRLPGDGARARRFLSAGGAEAAESRKAFDRAELP